MSNHCFLTYCFRKMVLNMSKSCGQHSEVYSFSLATCERQRLKSQLASISHPEMKAFCSAVIFLPFSAARLRISFCKSLFVGVSAPLATFCFSRRFVGFCRSLPPPFFLPLVWPQSTSSPSLSHIHSRPINTFPRLLLLERIFFFFHHPPRNRILSALPPRNLRCNLKCRAGAGGRGAFRTASGAVVAMHTSQQTSDAAHARVA